MGPFRRDKRSESAPAPDVEWRVRETGYRRLGHALASVVVTLEGPGGAQPGADCRLGVRNGSTSVEADPTMITREAPGSRRELQRLWFTVELSTVMFGDGDFALHITGQELPLPHPAPLSAWTGDADDEPAASAAAVSEAGLRAAVAELEERCRIAENANTELRADGRRISEAMAATLAEVQREREELLDLVARTTADLERERERAGTPTAEPPADASEAIPARRPNQGLMERLSAARGAAHSDEPH